MTTIDTSTAREEPTYGNWSRPSSPGLWKLGLFGTAWLFVGVLLTIFIGLASFVASLVFLGFLLLSLVPVIQVDRWGRNAYVRLWEQIQWINHRMSGRQIFMSGPLSRVTTSITHLPGLAAQASVGESVDAHHNPFVVIYQPSVKHVSTCLELSPPGTSLVDSDEINQQVASYGQWLSGLGHEEGLVGASIVVETSPDTGVKFKEAVTADLAPNAPAMAAETLKEIAETFPVGSAATSYRLTLTWSLSRKGSSRRRPLFDVVDDIANRLPELAAGLANTGAGAVRPTTRDELAAAVRTAFDPHAAQDLDISDENLSWSDVGPIQAEEKKGHYLHDDVASISWFMGEAPRGSVRSSILTNILRPHSEVPNKRFTVLYRPYDPAKAATLVEDDVTNAIFNAGQTARANARATYELRSVEQAATEEARGAGLIRFAMIVTATGEAAQLERMASVVEQSGTASRIQLRRAWRSQATAFIASLPLGIVLPHHVRVQGEWRENV